MLGHVAFAVYSIGEGGGWVKIQRIDRSELAGHGDVLGMARTSCDY